MHSSLSTDAQNIPILLNETAAYAIAHLAGVADLPPSIEVEPSDPHALPEKGVGAMHALGKFVQHHAPHLGGSPGPRYWGFVTGGATPAALIGDWLTSTYDQNAADPDTQAAQIELETLHMLRQLFGLSEAHTGAFVTGATMSNFVGLSLARQWVGRQHGIDVAEAGLQALPAFNVLTAVPHSSTYKSLAMLGIGRNAIQKIPTLPNREAIDINALEQALVAQNGQPCIVVASAGTVNSVDFDDIQAIVALKERHPFWLHVDAAFGGFAACSPKFAHLLAGWDSADSICIDAHKWLNVPYEAAMQFTRHADLQFEVFRNSAAYLSSELKLSDFVHRTPENSQRMRSLPAWFSLMAYGRDGYRDIVERNCDLAQQFAALIDASEAFELLTPVRLNGIVFTLVGRPDSAEISAYLKRLRDDGRVYLTPTVYIGVPAIRVSIVNWQTQSADLDIAWVALNAVIS